MLITQSVISRGIGTRHAAPEGGGGAALFTDDLSSGDRSHTENGWSYGDSDNIAVVSEKLQFTYPGVASGFDGFSEQRLISTNQYNEIWIKYDLYVPANYDHRTDAPGNNKFIAVFATPYTNPGFQMNFSLYRTGAGDSQLAFHRLGNGSEIEPEIYAPGTFIGSADRDNTMTVIVNVRVPTNSSSSDGVARLWKNGTKIFEKTDCEFFGNQGRNYISEFYLLGWANSGFDNQTIFTIDNIEVNDTNLWGVS